MTEGLVGRLERSWQVAASSARHSNSFSTALWSIDQPRMDSVDMDMFVLAFALTPIRSHRSTGARRQDMSMRKGTVGLLAPGPTGLWDYSNSHDVFHLYANQRTFDEFAEKLEVSASRSQQSYEFCDLEDRLLAAAMNELLKASRVPIPSPTYVDCLADVIFARILARTHEKALSVANGLAKGGLSPWQVRRVHELMMADLSVDHGLARLSKEVNLSSFHFSRAFRASTGAPPHRYLVALRLERACQLLEETNLPVTEIAAQVGYDDPGNLSRVFQREIGCSPSTYRQKRCM